MKKKELGCGYVGFEFGAHYRDGLCIDGYMWDMDSGGIDENGHNYLDSGGGIPCPKCNFKARVEYFSDVLIEEGACSLLHPLTAKSVKNVYKSWPSNVRRVALRYWRQGRRVAIREAKLRRRYAFISN